MYVRISIYIHIYIHIYMYIHICINVQIDVDRRYCLQGVVTAKSGSTCGKRNRSGPEVLCACNLLLGLACAEGSE